MIELVSERGYGGATVRGLSRLAGVSTKSFYECFENVEDCFAAAYAWIVRETVRRATESAAEAPDRLRMRIRAFFKTLAEQPKAARFVLVEAPSAGPDVQTRTRVPARTLERFIADELDAASRPVRIESDLADGAAAAALHLARSRLLSGPRLSTDAVGNEFTDWLLALRGGAAPRERLRGDGAMVGRYVPAPTLEIADDRCFLLAAVSRLGMRGGYALLTVPAICREAGVSRRTFDRHFDGVADCFLAAVEARVESSLARATADSAAAGSWKRAVAMAVAAICAEFAREPGLARFALVDTLAPGEPGLRLWERTVVRWARSLRQAAPSGIRLGQVSAEASIAAAIGIAASEAAAGRAERIGRAAPSIAFLVLAPAIGAGAADRTISREFGAALQPRAKVIKHSTQFS